MHYFIVKSELQPDVHQPQDVKSEPQPDVHQPQDVKSEPQPDINHSQDVKSEPQPDIHQPQDVMSEQGPDVHQPQDVSTIASCEADQTLGVSSEPMSGVTSTGSSEIEASCIDLAQISLVDINMAEEGAVGGSQPKKETTIKEFLGQSADVSSRSTVNASLSLTCTNISYRLCSIALIYLYMYNLIMKLESLISLSLIMSVKANVLLDFILVMVNSFEILIE